MVCLRSPPVYSVVRSVVGWLLAVCGPRVRNKSSLADNLQPVIVLLVQHVCMSGMLTAQSLKTSSLHNPTTDTTTTDSAPAADVCLVVFTPPFAYNCGERVLLLQDASQPAIYSGQQTSRSNIHEYRINSVARSKVLSYYYLYSVYTFPLYGLCCNEHSNLIIELSKSGDPPFRCRQSSTMLLLI